METERNFAEIGRATQTSGQAMQHFMSNSPWSAEEPVAQVQREIRRTPAFQSGGILILDESADEKAGEKTVGASRQYNGRLGKIEMSQVGVFLTFAHPATHTWTWIDGELFLPEVWFTEEKAALRKQLGVPEDRTFQTKIELGWAMIERVHARKLPFEFVCCDDLYGRSRRLRTQMDQAGIVYMADIPCNLWVWEGEDPNDRKRRKVQEIANDPALTWERVTVRPTARGEIADRFAVKRVFVPYDEAGTTVREEWLVLRRHEDETLSYALSNASAETPFSRLAQMKCGRHFVERSIQEAKSEIGWDDLRARKLRAWEHHLALTIMATWFIAQTKLDWQQNHPPDPKLCEELGVDRLPELSMANVREILRAVMPLTQLTPDDAASLVVDHLLNRVSSRKSRLQKRSRSPN